MTEDSRDDELNQEERAIEQALSQTLATEDELLSGAASDAATVREYTELIGLLAYQVPAETPAPLLKERLLSFISGAPSTATAPGSRPELDEVTLFGSSATADSADITLHRHTSSADLIAHPDSVDITLNQPGVAQPVAAQPAATPPRAAAASPVVTPLRAPVPTMPARSSWGGYAMAAVLALSLVGLGYMGALVGQQRQQIEQLQARIVTSPPSEEIDQAQSELVLLRKRLTMVTMVARKAYPMRRVSQSNSGVQPEGIVYVCGQHQRWYLSLRGLEPPEDDHEYHIWFMTEQGKIDGGVLDVRDDTSSEMDAVSMPDGTHGFLVTLEPTDPSAAPESLTILLGERAINL